MWEWHNTYPRIRSEPRNNHSSESLSSCEEWESGRCETGRRGHRKRWCSTSSDTTGYMASDQAAGLMTIPVPYGILSMIFSPVVLNVSPVLVYRRSSVREDGGIMAGKEGNGWLGGGQRDDRVDQDEKLFSGKIHQEMGKKGIVSAQEKSYRLCVHFCQWTSWDRKSVV